MDSNDPVIVRRGVGVAAGMLGAIVARQVIHRIRVRQGKDGQRPGKVEAMLWTSLVGAGASFGRAAAQRAVTTAYARREARAETSAGDRAQAT